MVIIESELTQMRKDTEAELYTTSIRRRDLKILLGLIDTIKLTPRTVVIPAVASIPAEIEEDGKTIKTVAVAAVPETTEEIFDVQPIDKNLGNTPMEDSRRQGIYNIIVSKKTSLGF